MRKLKFMKNDTRIIKFKFCNFTVFCKEKSGYREKIKFLGIPVLKSKKKEKDNGVTVQKVYCFNIPVVKIKKNKYKKTTCIFGVPVLKRKIKNIYYKYYFLGINICKKIIPNSLVSEKVIIKVSSKETLTFPKYIHPEVSIIIPVYNQYKYTMQCLKSIMMSEDPTPYEIIIADDHSTDETQNITENVFNIKVSRCDQNLGYIHNINKAAKLAAGKYVYFLNNDTIVQKNWLKELVHVFDIKQDAGVAGSKIFNNDWSLQECGVYMFADGFVNRNSFNLDPNNSRHMYLKQVDYVSGCSLLTPKKLFDEIGGFDILFSPAYCDDPDYCLEALKRGYKTYVQPKSHIVHLGSISYNSQSTSLMKRNNLLLREKWESYFSNRVCSWVNPDCSSIEKQPCLLIVDDLLPQFDKNAGGKTIFQFCQLFIKMGLNVKFCPFFGSKEQPYYSILSDMGIEIIDKADVKEWITVNRRRLDYLFLCRPQIAENFLIKQIIATGIKVLYYGHDLHHVRMQREREITQNYSSSQEIENMKQIEELTVKYVNWAYYPSVFEENYIKTRFGLSNVSAVPPYLYDVAAMPKHKPFEQSANIIFVGSTHGPNEDGLIWFIDHVLPIVTQKIPNIVLNVVGGCLSNEMTKRCGRHVKLLGYQTEEELKKLYASSKIAIAPLRYGAGIKGKIVDAVFHGVPVVTTDIGAEGVDLSHGCISVGNTKNEFARLVISLYTKKDRWNKHVLNSKKFISEGYSFEKAVKIFSKQIIFPAASQKIKGVRKQ